MFTHRSEEALSGGEFFTRVAWKVARLGERPRDAIDAAAAEMSPWIQQQVAKGVAKFQEATDPSSALSKEEFVDDLARHRGPPFVLYAAPGLRATNLGRRSSLRCRRATARLSFFSSPPRGGDSVVSVVDRRR